MEHGKTFNKHEGETGPNQYSNTLWEWCIVIKVLVH